MTIVELELPMTAQVASVGAEVKRGKSGSSDEFKSSEHMPRLDTLFDDDHSILSRIPDWLDTDTDERCSSDLALMEDGRRGGYGAMAAKSQRQPRRTSRKIIGPSSRLPDEEKTQSIPSDADQRRRVRMCLIIGLLFVLLGIFLSVVLTIVSCRHKDAKIFDDDLI